MSLHLLNEAFLVRGLGVSDAADAILDDEMAGCEKACGTTGYLHYLHHGDDKFSAQTTVRYGEHAVGSEDIGGINQPVDDSGAEQKATKTDERQHALSGKKTPQSQSCEKEQHDKPVIIELLMESSVHN